jgi:hypothetical protein
MLIYDVIEEVPASTVNSGSRLQLIEYTPTDEEVADILYDTSSYDNSDRNSPRASTGGTRGTGSVPTTTGGAGSTGGTTPPTSTGGTSTIPQTRTVTVNGVTYTISTKETESEADDEIVIDGKVYNANSYINQKEEEAKQEQLLNNGSADGSTGEKVDSSNPNSAQSNNKEVVEPCIEKQEDGSSGGGGVMGATGGTDGTPNTQEDTTPIAPRVEKRGKNGTFKSSIKNKNAPLIFVVGGVDVNGISPGDVDSKKEGYMWTGTGTAKKGYNDLQEFNIYNCFTSLTSKNGWAECEKVLKEQKITPSKYILVLYSGGVAGGHSGVLTVKTADEWDQIHISGPPLGHPTYGTNEKGFNKYIDTINKAGKDRVYYWAVGTGDAEAATRTDWKKKIIDSLPKSNVNTTVANHYEQIETVSQSIKSNNLVEPGTKSEVVVTEPVKTQKVCDDLTKVTAKKKANEGPEGGAENVTEARETSDGESKPADPKAPPKNEEPTHSGKFNHRFYQYPIDNNTKPTTLEEMLDPRKPWYKRYWAWRSSDLPGYGLEGNESLIASADGTPLVTSMIPYWPPPANEGIPEGKKQIIKPKPTVMGSWKNLKSSYNKISSVFDIPIILNSPDSGVVNGKIGYLFEQGNELHMTISSAKNVHNIGKGATIGLGVNTNSENKNDANWGKWSRWDGYFAKHCLENSGFNTQPDIENVNKYHENLIKSGKIANYPGNKKWKSDELLSAMQHGSTIKPSKLWFNHLNEEELLNNTADCAIFVVDYHIDKKGFLTEAGKKLVSHIIDKLKWKMATISTVSYHNLSDNDTKVHVLPYLDNAGNIITISGQVNANKPDGSMASNSTISVKKQTLYDIAKINGDSWLNGSIFITNVKKTPKDSFRDGDNLNTKLYDSAIINSYFQLVEKKDAMVVSSLYDNIKDILTKAPEPPVVESPPISGNQAKDAAAGNLPFNLRGANKYKLCQPCEKNDIGGPLKNYRTGQNYYTIGGDFPNIGGEAGVWGSVLTKFQTYMIGKGIPELSGATVKSLGAFTSAWRGTYTMGDDRACGSYHSAGLAQDMTINLPNLLPEKIPEGSKKDFANPRLAKSVTFNKVVIEFCNANNFKWGGTFFSNDISEIIKLPNGTAAPANLIKDTSEHHHFEANSVSLKNFFSGYRNDLKIKYNVDYTTINSTTLLDAYELALGPQANYLAWTQGFSVFRTKRCRRPKTNQEWNGRYGKSDKAEKTGPSPSSKNDSPITGPC